MSTLSQAWRGIFPPCKAVGMNRAILRAAVSVGAAGIFVKILATIKEVAVASVYGRSDAMDAFLAAALIPSLARQSHLGIDESGTGANAGPGEGTGGPRARPAASVEFHALDVPSSGRRQRRHGACRPRLFPAHRLALCAGQAHLGDALVLWPSADRSHHRNRHQLHGSPQYG